MYLTRYLNFSLRLFKSCSKDRDGKLSDSNFLCGETDLKRVVYELFWHVIRGDLRQEDALLVMQEVACIIPVVLLKERLDMETLDAVGLIQSQKAFNQKYVKTKTKLL
ncbi:predicted protein [Nematostella vectensis]|uniref:Uncharacterized protein n=1 Tax=Nematostella vectensis TaxID=45351 RepID=A7SLL2_NEMVE|nr:predicted protein [Nematostella vectensis]|eukprot:XP_001627514.1 predicted protein [Nematostella vectensis]